MLNSPTMRSRTLSVHVLTTKDSVIEVNFGHVYKIYENLEICLELGWLRLNFNRRTWNIRARSPISEFYL
jgi:hypothetical protein